MSSLTFPSRVRARSITDGKARVYKSTDGRYKVIEIDGLAGRYWLAVRCGFCDYPIKTDCKSRAAAVQACELHRSR